MYSISCVRHRNASIYQDVANEFFDPEHFHVHHHPTALRREFNRTKPGFFKRLKCENEPVVVLVEATAVRNLATDWKEAIEIARKKISNTAATILIIDPDNAHTMRRIPQNGQDLTGTQCRLDPNFYDPHGPAKVIKNARQISNLTIIETDDSNLPEKLRQIYRKVALKT